MRVFISHSSKDKPAVEALARALRERGVDAWLDKWMIGPGDDIVAMINEGLEQADAGLIVFSAHTRESRWVEAEVSYLTYARIQEGKALIPVVLGGDAYVPALLRPLARRGIEEVDAIADAVLHRRAGPPPVVSRAVGRCERVLVSLRREGASGVRVQVDLGGKEYGGRVHSALPRQVAVARDAFLRGFRAGLRRGPAEATRTSLESQVADLGRALRALCLPAGAGEALADLADGCGVGTIVEVCFESDAPELLGLPFEALRLPDERLLATLPAVVTLRRPAGLCQKPQSPLAGPIKVLVAVGAPDEGNTRSAVLDYERELQNILDAVEVAQRRENVQVRIGAPGSSPSIDGHAAAHRAHAGTRNQVGARGDWIRGRVGAFMRIWPPLAFADAVRQCKRKGLWSSFGPLSACAQRAQSKPLPPDASRAIRRERVAETKTNAEKGIRRDLLGSCVQNVVGRMAKIRPDRVTDLQRPISK